MSDIDPEPYLVLSRKWSEGEEYIVFYRADSKGYTQDLKQAGIYTKGEAEKIERETHGDCVAIPRDKIEEKEVRQLVPWNMFDDRFKAQHLKKGEMPEV